MKATSGWFGSGALLLAAVALVGCSSGSVGGPDGGIDVHNPCNSKANASLPACQLQPGVPLSKVAPLGGRYISVAGEVDWYSVTTPATTTGRSILHVTGGYTSSNTAVNFTVTVLRADGVTPLLNGVDLHGQAAPHPVDAVLSFKEASAPLLIRVEDTSSDPQHPNFDTRHPYDLKVEVVQDPDPNEGNDPNPTPLPLTAQNGYVGATMQGFLATPGDVDPFSVTVPTGGGRKVLYVGLKLASIDATLVRPVNYRIAYTVNDSQGHAVAEGRALNQFVKLDTVGLGTARLVTAGSTYTVLVQAYQDPNVVGTPPGDLSFQYTLDVRVVDDADPNEPNDTIATATPVTIGGVGSTKVLTGRLGYIADADYYLVSGLPGGSVLHYKYVATTNGGRFPVIPGNADRSVRIFSMPSASDTCRLDPGVCPKNFDTQNGNWQESVNNYCNGTWSNPISPPLCLYSSRTEVPQQFPNLKNVEGAVAVPSSGSTQFLILVNALSDDYADDLDYQLQLDVQGGGVSASNSATLGTTNVAFSGKLNAGNGRLFNYNPFSANSDGSPSPGVRGPQDYDAVVSSDKYTLNLPLGSPPYDRTWNLSWSVTNLPDGSKPYDLVLEVQFCDADADPTCTNPAKLPNSGVLGYITRPQAPWYITDSFPSPSILQYLYDLNHTPAVDTVTSRPYSCLCLEPRFVRAGHFVVTARPADRNAYDPNVVYTINTSTSAYPQSFALNDGGTGTCPAPVLDGGLPANGGYLPGCNLVP